MKSLALIPLFALVVAAQQNPFIPASVSQGCSAFLTKLNADSGLAACTKSLNTALTQFAPGKQASNVTEDALKSTLKSLCSSSTTAPCTSTNLATQLASFYSSCGQELVSSTPNPIVQTTYDVLYMLEPFLKSVCQLDSSGAYCALSIGSSVNTGDLAQTVSASGGSAPSANKALHPDQLVALKLAQSKILVTVHTEGDYPNGIGGPEKRGLANVHIAKPEDLANGLGAPAPAIAARADPLEDSAARLRRAQAESELARRAEDVTALMANATTFRASGVQFLFLLDSLPAEKLCTKCSQLILSNYIGYGQTTPYGTSLDKSLILSGEEPLYKAALDKCGQEFADGILNAAGANPNSEVPSAATSVHARIGAVMAAVAGAVWLVL